MDGQLIDLLGRSNFFQKLSWSNLVHPPHFDSLGFVFNIVNKTDTFLFTFLSVAALGHKGLHMSMVLRFSDF